MGGRKPAVHGIHTGFGAEANDTDQDYDQGQLLMSGYLCAVQKAPVAERNRSRGTGIDIKDSQKAHQSAGNGIEHVFQTGRDRFFAHLMHDHGHCGKGCQFEGKIQGHHIRGHAYCHHGPQSDEKECEKHGGPFLVLHIGKGVKTNGSEKDQDSRQGESPQIIQLEGEHSLLRKMQYLHPLCPDEGQDSQEICQYHDQAAY